MDALNLTIKLNKLHCYDESDGAGDAEPYLWTVFFKVDGDTVTVTEKLGLQGTATVVGTPGNQGNLNNTDVSDGENVAIPAAIGEYHTVLRPIPLQKPILGTTHVGGIAGVLTVLMEEDNTPNAAIAKGHVALNKAVQQGINTLIPTLNFLHQQPTDADIDKIKGQISAAVIKAVKSDVNVFEWLVGVGDMDDQIGTQVFMFPHKNLVNAGGSGMPIRQRWKVQGDWELIGQATAKKLPRWNGWFVLGGKIKGAVAVVQVPGGPEDMYVRGEDDALWQKWWDGAFHPSDLGWSRHEDGFLLASAPAVISLGVNHRDVYVQGKDGGVYHKYWDGQKWNGWYGLGGKIIGAPAVVAVPGGPIDIYVRGTDNELYQKWWDGKKWHPSDTDWLRHPDGFKLGSSPCVISAGANHRDVYVQGKDGGVYHKYWDGQRWNGWYGLGGKIIDAPTAVIVPGGPPADIYVRGMDNALYQKWWDGQKWNPSDSGWLRHEEAFSLGSAPSVVSSGVDDRDVFARGSDGSVNHKFWG